MSATTANPATASFEPEFFHRETLAVARDLLGAELSTAIQGTRTAGRIIEVEAYGALPDPASHGFRGRTERNQVLFWGGGHCYVYLIYGVHYCVNISTEHEGKGCGVLIRAIEPTEGIEIMRRRRRVARESLLTNGPGRLCQALGIDLAVSGHNYLSSPRINVRPGIPVADSDVVTTTRIGITHAADRPWRFYVRANPFVSRK